MKGLAACLHYRGVRQDLVAKGIVSDVLLLINSFNDRGKKCLNALSLAYLVSVVLHAR